MAYIGKEPIVGNFQVCDAISVVNGQAAYTMQVSSTNVVPESANHMLVSLNGILQKPGSSFTISGSTITFASALATGDVIDFIMLLGNVLDLGVPSDATVTDAKANFVSTSSAAGLQIKGDGTTDGTLQLNCSQNSHGVKIASPAHSAGQSYTLTLPTGNVTADKFLKVASVSGSGTTGIGQLSFADAGGGLNLISTTNVTSGTGSVDITGMDSTYKNYKILISNCHGATDNVTLNCRFIIGGSAQTGSYYNYVNHVIVQDGTPSHLLNSSPNATSSKIIYGGAGNANHENLFSEITIPNPSETTFRKFIQVHTSYVELGSMAAHNINTTSYTDGTAALTGIQFFFSSGNIDNAIFKLYGIS